MGSAAYIYTYIFINVIEMNIQKQKQNKTKDQVRRNNFDVCFIFDLLYFLFFNYISVIAQPRLGFPFIRSFLENLTFFRSYDRNFWGFTGEEIELVPPSTAKFRKLTLNQRKLSK